MSFPASSMPGSQSAGALCQTAAIRQRMLNYLQRLILICDLTHQPADSFSSFITPVETFTSPGDLTEQNLLPVLSPIFQYIGFVSDCQLDFSVFCLRSTFSVQIPHLKFFLCLTSLIFLRDILTFVIQFLSSCHSDLHFHQAVLKIHL